MAKASKKQTDTILKLILFVVAGLGFLALVFNAFKSTVLSSKLVTEYNTLDLLKELGNVGTDTKIGTATNLVQYGTLFFLIFTGVACLASIVALAFNKFGVMIARIGAVLSLVASILVIISAFIAAGQLTTTLGSIKTTTGSICFMPWFTLIIAVLTTIISIFALSAKRK